MKIYLAIEKWVQKNLQKNNRVFKLFLKLKYKTDIFHEKKKFFNKISVQYSILRIVQNLVLL